MPARARSGDPGSQPPSRRPQEGEKADKRLLPPLEGPSPSAGSGPWPLGTLRISRWRPCGGQVVLPGLSPRAPFRLCVESAVCSVVSDSL